MGARRGRVLARIPRALGPAWVTSPVLIILPRGYRSNACPGSEGAGVRPGPSSLLWAASLMTRLPDRHSSGRSRLETTARCVSDAWGTCVVQTPSQHTQPSRIFKPFPGAIDSLRTKSQGQTIEILKLMLIYKGIWTDHLKSYRMILITSLMGFT